MSRWRTPSALDRQMGLVRRERGVDPVTGEPVEGPSEEQILANFKKLAVCHQPEDGPCTMHRTMPPDDKRCRMSRRMKISCPYLGKVEPLKELIEEEAEEKLKDEMIVEEFPEIDL